jgi:hypothetical protein
MHFEYQFYYICGGVIKCINHIMSILLTKIVLSLLFVISRAIITMFVAISIYIYILYLYTNIFRCGADFYIVTMVALNIYYPIWKFAVRNQIHTLFLITIYDYNSIVFMNMVLYPHIIYNI